MNTGNSDVSSAKRLTFEFKPLGKSLMQIKNSKGPRIDPSGTPALTSAHDECWPFNTTLCFIQLKKYFIKVIRSSNIPFGCNLKSKPSLPNSIKRFTYIEKDTPYIVTIIKRPSNPLPQTGITETGQYFFMHCLSPFSNAGTTFAFFHVEGN